MFHVMLNKINKLSLLRALENGRYLSMNFAEYQAFMDHQDCNSAEKTVIFALQTDRKNIMYKNASEVVHCNLINIKLYLNFEFYPYDESRFSQR